MITGPGDGSADSNSQRILLFDVNSGSVTLAGANTVSLAEHTAGLLFGSVVVAGGDYGSPEERSVQGISDGRCAVCITAAATVTTFAILPTFSDDALGDVIGNKYYILGGHSSRDDNLPELLIGTP